MVSRFSNSMDSFESVCNKLIKQPEFWVRVLIGSVIAAIPLVNVFAFGYLRQMIKENDTNDDTILPAWNFSSQNIINNFWDGLLVSVFSLIFLYIPAWLGYGLGYCLSWFFEPMKLLMMYIAFLIGLPTTIYAMLLVKNMDELCSIHIIIMLFKRTIHSYKMLLVPMFLFLCLMILSVQLLPHFMLGMPLFIGMIFMIAFMKNLQIVYIQ